MKNRLSNLKNLLWAAGILLCLLALLIGLVFAMSQKNRAETVEGTLVLGAVERPKKAAAGDSFVGANGQVGTLIALPEIPKGSLETVFGMTFLCDKTVLGLSTYATHYGEGVTAQIWTDDGSGLRVKDGADMLIRFTDGSLITPADAAMITRPKTVVIYLGGDGLADTTQQEFVDGYCALINSIRTGSPSTNIIVCSIASVCSNYQGGDGLNPTLIFRANAWIKQVCVNTGVYYADLAPLLNDDYGYLSDAYLTPDGRSIAAAGINNVVEYFRFHGIPS